MQQTVLNERIIKNLKTSVANLGKLMEKQTEELEAMRKRERLYELQKRCLDDSNRKVNLYSAKITILNEKLQQNRTINSSIETEKTAITKYQTEIKELGDFISMLTEENRLLRDYAYNVDPDALIMHQHKFI